MKKQIFILVLAFFALSFSNAYGQTPRPLTCGVTEGPLSPQLGKTYTYSVSVPNNAQFTGTPSLTYQWFVTKSKTFVTAGSIVATPIVNNGADFDAVVASGTYNDAANTSPNIDIKWKTNATPTDPYFLVVNTVGKNGICDPKNMRIYKIAPANMFTLDITNVDVATGTALPYSALFGQCYQDIQSITWDVTKANEATYDYGSNTLVWAVAAANFATSWTPTLLLAEKIKYNEGVTLTWNTKADGTGTAGVFTTTDSLTWTTTNPVPASLGSVGSAGEVVFIRMVLDHTTATKQSEGINDQSVILAIDGVTESGSPDLHYSNTEPVVNTDCGLPDGFKYDIAPAQTVKQRPNIVTNPASVPFLTPIR